MKKVMVWLLLLMFCLGLLGCGTGSGDGKTTKAPDPVSEEPVAAPSLNLEPVAGNVVQVCIGWDHIALLRTDGTVAAAGENGQGQCEVSGWSGIVKLYASDSGTLGVKQDGTVVATWFDAGGWQDVDQVFLGDSGLALGLTRQGHVLVGGTEDPDLSEAGQWTDIRSLAVQYDCIYGLKNDGTVVFAGLTHDDFMDSCAHCLIPTWTKVEKLFCYDYYLAGVRSDGTVLSSCPEVLHVKGWSDLAMAVTTYPCYFGVSEDGRILTEDMLGVWTDGTFFYSQDHLYPEVSVEKADLSDFANLKQLLAWSPGGYMFGLKTNGNLAQFPRGTLDASQWTDIVKLEGGYETMAALRADGTVLTWSALESCPDTGSWENIVEVLAVTVDGMPEFLGLCADGTLVGTGGLAAWDLNRLTK